MSRRKPLPQALHGSAFTSHSASEHGVPRSRLRALDLEQPHHGVHAPREHDDDVLVRAGAYAPLLHNGQFFSHSTAALIWGLPLPRRLSQGRLHVSSRAPARAPRGAEIRGHKLDGQHWEVTDVDGLSVATPADAWCQLALLLSERELVIAGDGLLRRKNPLATRKQIVRGLARMNGRRGVQKLRAAYEQLRDGTDSPMETELRLDIVGVGLPEPVVNFEIRDRIGNFLALGDLVFVLERVLVEYDGGTHFLDEGQIFHDIDRLDAVMAEGWRVIRVNRSHLSGDRSHILQTIAQAVRHSPAREGSHMAS